MILTRRYKKLRKRVFGEETRMMWKIGVVTETSVLSSEFDDINVKAVIQMELYQIELNVF